MAREQFGELKSIKITKETWKRLRVRSAEVERPMTALVEVAVVAYLTGHIPMTVTLTSEHRACLHCGTAVTRAMVPDGQPLFCSEPCRQAWTAETVGP